MNKLLEISGLHISFGGDEDTVKGVSLYINRGEIVGISGASGSGKSLTMWALMGLLPGQCRSSGSYIMYNAKGEHSDMFSSSGMRTLAGRSITLIPQNPFTSLNPVFRCGAQIAEMLKHRTNLNVDPKEKVLRHLSDLGFPQPERIYNAYPFELSGGQLQRIVIAMATIGEPELVIADEPTTALDVLTQTEVLDLLCGWARTGDKSMFLVSHDVSLLQKYCDRIYILQDGEIARSGTAQEMSQWMQEYPVRTSESAVRNRGDGRILCATQALRMNYRGRSGETIEAVRDLTLQIYSGESVGLVGSTGCGKSTLAKAMTGLLSPEHGFMTFAGSPLDYDRFPGLRGQIQMVFQDPYSALYPHLTVGAYLEEAIRLYQLADRDNEDALIGQTLTKVGLSEDFAGRYPHQLSGGERQRVQIARAILLKPKLLICDEITSGLDAAIQDQILQLLKRLHQDTGMALLIISHNLNVIRFMTDYVFVMEAGQIVEEGDAHRVFTHPAHPVTKALLAVQDQDRVS